MADDRELKGMQQALAALTPLDDDERQRALAWLASKLDLEAPTPSGGIGGGTGGSPGATGGSGDVKDIKAFLRHKKPPDDVARATSLGYQLAHGDNKASFTTTELNAARIKAALPTFNMSRAVSNAQRAKFITTAGKRGTYQVTSLGEAVVEALPDLEAVKAAKAAAAGRRRRKPARKKKSPAKKPAARKP